MTTFGKGVLRKPHAVETTHVEAWVRVNEEAEAEALALEQAKAKAEAKARGRARVLRTLEDAIELATLSPLMPGETLEKRIMLVRGLYGLLPRN
jgi:hypothetical protein